MSYYMNKNSTKIRDSNIEIYRILLMILIISHHYVVNSGLLSAICTNPTVSFNSIYLILLGAFGKTGINCFVLITGYYMCNSHISIYKFFRLLFEIVFYSTIIYLLFCIFGYTSFSFIDFFQKIFPIYYIDYSFAKSFLIFYLLIPFVNLLIKILDRRSHLYLLLLVLMVTSGFPTFLNTGMTVPYPVWFIVIYLIGAFIRLYPPKCFNNVKCSASLTIGLFFLSLITVLFQYWRMIRFGANNEDIFSFSFFKNIKMSHSTIVNKISSTTFGILLIHANSNLMRSFLWGTLLHNISFLDSKFLILHSLVCIFGVFFICCLIDIFVTYFFKNTFLNFLEKKEYFGLKKYFIESVNCLT